MIYIGFDMCGESETEMHECGIVLRDYMLSSLLKEYSEDEIETAPHGKPFLKGGRVGFSLSHSGGAVCCAVNTGESDLSKNADDCWLAIKGGADREIGVDIEPVSRDVNFKKLAERFFSQREKAYATDKERFIELWTKKESLCKLSGRGIADMKSADTFAKSDNKTVTKTILLNGEEYKMSVSFKNT